MLAMSRRTVADHRTKPCARCNRMDYPNSPPGLASGDHPGLSPGAPAARLDGRTAGEEISDLLGCHGIPEPVESQAHDRTAADHFPAAPADVGVLAFAEPQVILLVQPHLARLNRDGRLLSGGTGGPGLAPGCWCAVRGWLGRGRSRCSRGDGRHSGRSGTRGGCRRRVRDSGFGCRQVNDLGCLVIWSGIVTGFRGNRTGMTRRKRPAGTAGLLFLDTFAQLSHSTPLRS